MRFGLERVGRTLLSDAFAVEFVRCVAMVSRSKASDRSVRPTRSASYRHAALLGFFLGNVLQQNVAGRNQPF